ncbi:uncharacterized protein LOC131931871 [Physella acuta]|uniref:uncharacterized protein LOC131931871 n=1 Tax=Physella acuta TaxID=109671 RepID=UPI0027DC5BAD|nr:uncharacterized protein LOC131931871 [Physella acuta]
MKTRAEQCKDEGNKCIKEGKYTEAVIHYTEAIKHEPHTAALYSNRSLAFLKIDQLYLAMEDAKKAVQLEPSWPKGFFRKAEIEFKAGHFNKALISYKQALILGPTDQGILAAIAKTNKEIAKEKQDAVRQPVMYTCLGLAVGVMVVAADQLLTTKPSIQFAILQVLLVASCGGVGFIASKVQRYLVTSQREALLEEPLDLLKEMGDVPREEKNNNKSSTTSSTTSSTNKHSQSAGRQRMRKGKS